jgi:hypothetical protein
MFNVILKDMIWYAKFILDEHHPSLTTFPSASYDARNYPLYLRIHPIVPGKIPAPERMPYFD